MTDTPLREGRPCPWSLYAYRVVGGAFHKPFAVLEWAQRYADKAFRSVRCEIIHIVNKETWLRDPGTQWRQTGVAEQPELALDEDNT